jgi:hypothetical protein
MEYATRWTNDPFFGTEHVNRCYIRADTIYTGLTARIRTRIYL